MQEFLGFSFQDSVIELLGGHCNAETVHPVPREHPKPIVKSFELPEANSDMRRVFAYLTKQRFISPDIISHFAHEHKIYEDGKYHNAVFVGMGENGVPKQASVRSTLSFGKGKVSVKLGKLQSAITAGLEQLRKPSQTVDELKITARKLYDIADHALRLSTEETLVQRAEQKETSEESPSDEPFQMAMS